MGSCGGKAALTSQEEDPAASGVSTQGADCQHHGAILPQALQLIGGFIQQHHCLVESGDEAAALLLVGDDVLQAHAALGPAPDDAAESHIAGAGDVSGAEGEEGAAVQQQAVAGALGQQGSQCATIHAANLHIDHR